MLTHPGIVLALVATVIYNLGFVLEKRALGSLPAIDAGHLYQLVRTLFTAPAWLAGFTLILGGMVLQILVLSLEPLTIAQPLQASGIVVTILLSWLILHEHLGRTELACIGFIAVAVLLLSLSSGHGPGAGTHASGLAVAAAAVPACLATLVIYGRAQRVSRRQHHRPVTGVSYSLCAGLMYGVAGLALKALSAGIFSRPGPRTVPGLLTTAAASPYLYVVLGCLAAGLCLFQTALQRSPVSIVVPISAIISTGYLVIIGSWLFHERLPSSPLLLTMRLVGGIAAVAAPVILARRASPASPAPPAPPVRGAPQPISPAMPASAASPASATSGPVILTRLTDTAPKGPRHEPGSAAAGPAGLPDRQAGAAVSGRRRSPVQPTAAPPLPRPRRHPRHAGRPGRAGR